MKSATANKRYWFFLLGLVLAFAAMAAAWHFIYRTPPARDNLIALEPGLTLRNVRYVKNVKGQTVWILEADSAKKDEATDSITGQGVKITFFKEGAPRYFLYADHGRAEIKTGLFKVWGNVVLETEDKTERLLTDELFYTEKEAMIYSEQKVYFEAPEIQGQGYILRYYLESGRAELKNDVTAEIVW
jgi:LPS export ABC transporter protein LptC